MASAKGNCLTGAFYFTDGKNMVDNHSLSGHGITSFNVPELTDCFRACRLDCQCISFNYKQTQNVCQLNEESRYTNASALGFAEGWQYYDVVIDYNIQVSKERIISLGGQFCKLVCCRMLIMIFPKKALCTKLMLSNSESEEISSEDTVARVQTSPIFVARGKRDCNIGSRRRMHAG